MNACWTKGESSIVWRLSVDGPCLDAAQIEGLRNDLDRAISNGARAVVIDLQRVDRLDPLGLAGLALLPQDFALTTRIVLAGLRPNVQEVALLVHLHDVLDIYEDARAAVFDLSSPLNQS